MLSSLLLSTATVAMLTAPSQPLTPAQERILFRVCAKSAADELDRCKARQLTRMGLKPTSSYTPTTVEVLEGVEQGNNVVRRHLREQNVTEAAEHWRQTRRTFMQSPTQGQPDDHQRRDYVDDIRRERLKCMLVASGRPRRLCLDQLGNRYRDQMRTERDEKTIAY